jgi:hypothetical protein
MAGMPRQAPCAKDADAGNAIACREAITTNSAAVPNGR